MFLRYFITAIIFIVLLFSFAYSQTQEIIKAGSLAPDGSDWSIIFEQMNSELVERTNGELQFRFFYGRDEKELVELLKNQQIDVALMSSAGLGTIHREIFVFQLPFLFADYEELDFVRNKLTPYFADLFDREGFVFLAWGDMGYVYLFSKEPVKTQTDLQKLQFWVWEIDPIGKAFASASGREPILLPVHSVLPSLKNNNLQAIYAPPLGCISLQWFTQVKYMTDMPLTVGIGATIMNKNRFSKFSDKSKNLLLEITKKYHNILNPKIREKNVEAIEEMKKRGIKIVTVPRREKQKWDRVAKRVQNQFVGDLYPKELLDKIKLFQKEYQNKNH